MKEKLKELLSIPTKTWEEERLINYLVNHFEEKGYEYVNDTYILDVNENKWKVKTTFSLIYFIWGGGIVRITNCCSEIPFMCLNQHNW